MPAPRRCAVYRAYTATVSGWASWGILPRVNPSVRGLVRACSEARIIQQTSEFDDALAHRQGRQHVDAAPLKEALEAAGPACLGRVLAAAQLTLMSGNECTEPSRRGAHASRQANS